MNESANFKKIHALFLSALVLLICSCTKQIPHKNSLQLEEIKSWSKTDAGSSSSQSESSNWWEQLGDPIVDQLVEASFVNNPTLNHALAQIELARAQVSFNKASLVPNSNLYAYDSKAITKSSGATTSRFC